MAVPTPSGVQAGSVTGGNTFGVNFTADGDAIYFVVVGTTFSGSGGFADFTVTADVDGTPMNRWVSWACAGASTIMRVWLFTLPAGSVAAGARTATFTAPVLSGTENYNGAVFNLANGPTHAGCVLPGGWFSIAGITSVTKTALGWADGGLQVTLGWAGQGIADLTLTGGTQLVSDNGLIVNTETTVDGELSYTAARPSSTNIGMFTFCIPPGSKSVSGGACFPMFGGYAEFAFGGAGETVVIPLVYGNAADLDPPRIANAFALDGATLRSLAARLQVAAGGGRVLRCTVTRNGYGDGTTVIGSLYCSDTTTTFDVTDPAQQATLDGINIPIYPYEQLAMRLTYVSGAGGLTGAITLSGLVEASLGTNEQTYGGGNLYQTALFTPGDPRFRAILHPIRNSWGSTPTQQRSLTGIDVTVTQLLATAQVDLPTAEEDYYMAIGSVVQDGSGGTVDTKASMIPNTLGRGMARRKFSLTIPAHSYLQTALIMPTAANSNPRSATAITVVPTTRGEMMLSGEGDQIFLDFDASANANVFPITSHANLAQVQNIVPPMTFAGADFHVLGAYADWETDPAAGAADWYIRKNLANSSIPPIASTIGGPTTGQTAGDEPYTGGDLLGMSPQLVSGVPLGIRQFWTIPGFVEPPPLTGTIIVTKQAGSDTTTPFSFSAGGGLSPASFDLTGGGSRQFDDVVPGSGYSVSETVPDGWLLLSTTVSNGSPSNNISVAAGETVTVTFTDAQNQGNACPLPTPAVVSGQNACPATNPAVV